MPPVVGCVMTQIEKPPASDREAAEAYYLLGLCETAQCRRVRLLAYFGGARLLSISIDVDPVDLG